MRYALLGLLAEEPDYGYRLKRRFDDSIGSFWELNNGQVYDSLRRLEASGLVVRVESPERPDSEDSYDTRRRYQATAKGQKVLTSWLRRRPAVPRPVRDEMFVRLAFLVDAEPSLLFRRLDDQERVYRGRLNKLLAERNKIRESADSYSRTLVLGFDAVMFHLEAHLKWIEHCRGVLGTSEHDSTGQAPKGRTDGAAPSHKTEPDDS